MAADEFGGAIDFELPTFNPGSANERVASGSAPSDFNPVGAGSDPFAYTDGSLLTPWTKTFNYGGPQTPAGGYYQGSGGFSPLSPFQYKDFAFNFKAPEAYTGQADFNAPTAFKGSRFNTPDGFKSPVDPFKAPGLEIAGQPAGSYRVGEFKAPTREEALADQGYQFTTQQGQQALENSAAAKGMLRSGNTWKALQDYGQQAASTQYDKVYGRRASEFDRSAELALAGYDRSYQAGLAENESAYGRAASEYDRMFQNALGVYQMGYQQDASEYDRNFGNSFNVHQFNQQNALQSWKANADVNLQGQNLGYQVASGTWDRNYSKDFSSYQEQARQAEAAAQIAAAEAAAAAGGAQWADAQNYNRALQGYNMEYEQFNNNQSNQFNRLLALGSLGQGSAAAAGSAAGQYGANAGNILMAGGNAGAAGVVGSANAWNSAAGNIANGANQAAMWAALQPPKLTSVTGP